MGVAAVGWGVGLGLRADTMGVAMGAAGAQAMTIRAKIAKVNRQTKGLAPKNPLACQD